MRNAKDDGIALEIHDVTKRYQGQAALQNVSLRIREGEVISIIGPSGSGKSTLLRCASLLELPESGRVEWPTVGIRYEAGATSPGSNERLMPILRKHVGLVFQGLNLWDRLTVLENLTLAPKVVLGEHQASIDSRASTVSRRLGIEALVSLWAWQLSGGQRQRVALARALMMQPKVLLLDEITSALDPLLTLDMMQLLRELRGEGMTMVVVSHHIDFASAISDRMVYLDGGTVAQEGAPYELLNRPASASISAFLSAVRAIH